MALVIDSRSAANAFLQRVVRDVRAFADRRGGPPGLAVVLVGHDAASEINVRRNRLAEDGATQIENTMRAAALSEGGR